MSEEELNCCSRLHVAGFRKPQAQPQPVWGSGSESTVLQHPPEPLRVPSWAPQALRGQWGSAAGTRALLGLEMMFSECGCAGRCSGSPLKALAQSWDTTFCCTHTHT